MKKFYALSLCTIMLLSCSLNLLAPSISSTPVPTLTITPTDLPSATPTVPTPTFTPTPPLVGLRTHTLTPTITATSTQPTETSIFLATLDTPTPSVEMKGFVSVNVSTKEFFKDAECQPTSVKFVAQVADSAGTAFVVLFVRFKSKQTGTTSEWTSIGMSTIGAGTYTYELKPEEMKGVDSFKNPWVQYQFVATNADANEIGRTGIFSERLSLLECEPTPSPSPSPEPTVLRP
ncbi:MAG TPA: hypothetical protein PKC52_07655 [Anaerolineales bacterium]|nr:hypothetical protein [Anaerolineales bacterium]